MLQPRIPTTLRTVTTPTPSATLLLALSRLTLISTPPHQQSRSASHASEGRANSAKQGPGKRLGAKKGDSELVVPGNIIFRQRGSHWFPGENCGMGRDHTIVALQKGFVRYYRDPEKHKDRKYIGVVLNQSMSLPRGRNGSRWRRVGMIGVPRKDIESDETLLGESRDGGLEKAGEGSAAVVGTVATKAGDLLGIKPRLQLKSNYMYRESNWSLGRAAERAGVKIKEHNPKNRFLAWRKTLARRAANVEKRNLRRKK